MELRRLLRLKINYMHLETKLGTSTIEIKFVHWYSSPTKLLIRSSAVIAPVLTEILNTSIRLRTYPSKLKIAEITPVFKSDDNTDANNYRPISLLSNFNRVFEKIIYNRLTSYIKKHELCIPHNMAFVRGIQPNTQYWTLLLI